MRVIALVENTSISKDYKSKHGLCLYIETKKHKLLFDLGSNSLFLGNAGNRLRDATFAIYGGVNFL